jgi:hypothetical protein
MQADSVPDVAGGMGRVSTPSSDPFVALHSILSTVLATSGQNLLNRRLNMILGVFYNLSLTFPCMVDLSCKRAVHLLGCTLVTGLFLLQIVSGTVD